MTYHNKDLKSKILSKTFELINEKGYRNVSTRMVARELGVSATAIYRHYENIEDLMKNVIKKGDYIFSDYLMKDYNKLKEKLLIMAKNYIEFSLEYSNLYDLFFISEYTPITSEDNMVCELETQGMSKLVDIIKKLIIIEQLIIDFNMLFTQLWSFIQGYSYLVRFHNFRIDENLIKHSINGIIEGWK